MRRMLLLLGVLCAGCGSGGSSGSSTTGGSGGSSANSLAGTWDLTTTPVSGSPVHSTVVVDQDSLTIHSPDFEFTGTRAGDALDFVDSAGGPGVFDGTRTTGSLDLGIIPIAIGGSWTFQGGVQGDAPSVRCTMQLGAHEIDASCDTLGPTDPWFSFTSSRDAGEDSSFGDLGGTWHNVWVNGAKGSKSYPCDLHVSGNDVDTCAGGAVNGAVDGSPLAGITFTYDGADTISGSAHGWAEFSAKRR